MPGSSKVEGGEEEEEEEEEEEVEEEEEEEEEGRRVDDEVTNEILTSGPIDSTARGDGAAEVEGRNAERGSGGDVARDVCQTHG